MFPLSETKQILGVLTVALAATCGCESGKSKESAKRTPTALQRDDITQMDRWAVTSPMRAQADAAIVRELTLDMSQHATAEEL